MQFLPTPRTRLPSLAQALLCLVTLGGAAAGTAPPELRPPPSGFSWQSIAEIRAYFLLPDGWHFQRIDAALDLDYVLTPGRVETVTDLQMGLRVSVLFETERKKGVKAGVFGKATADLFEKRGQVLTRWTKQQGPFEITSLMIENPTSPWPLTFFQIFANTETDTLYWISFTSSSGDSWDDDWERFGSPIFDGFFLETEV